MCKSQRLLHRYDFCDTSHTECLLISIVYRASPRLSYNRGKRYVLASSLTLSYITEEANSCLAPHAT